MSEKVKQNEFVEECRREVLTGDAVHFIGELQSNFNLRRLKLLEERAKRQEAFDRGEKPGFLSSTKQIREGDWVVSPVAEEIRDRRVEITGPTDAKMLINGLNSGAKVFMADIEDSLSPTWKNILSSQINLKKAVRHTLSFTDKTKNKEYKLKDKNELATLFVRPRGWHLEEKHFQVDGENVSASLFDFGMYFFHNAKELISQGKAPYFYLPKLESHLEARLWNDVFNFSQDYFEIPRGTIKATCLIETIVAAFEMDEILFELKDHSAGLNAGRWDYIFSAIKKFRNDKLSIFPDRSNITMTVPFMKAYTELLVQTCHKRNAFAIGGMSAFIPNRTDPVITQAAIEAVRQDKLREAESAYDGTWVAHPDLVGVAKEVFDSVLGERPNQIDIKRSDARVKAGDLLNFSVNGGVTEKGVRKNISVSLQYINYWLDGQGAVGLDNLMEDAATAEISRAQLWQWLHNGVEMSDGKSFNDNLYKEYLEEELSSLRTQTGKDFNGAKEILDDLITSETFSDFLTIPGYEKL